LVILGATASCDDPGLHGTFEFTTGSDVEGRGEGKLEVSPQCLSGIVCQMSYVVCVSYVYCRWYGHEGERDGIAIVDEKKGFQVGMSEGRGDNDT
jgi:hypothetical protein